jgi:lysophospholipase L1-like esterase
LNRPITFVVLGDSAAYGTGDVMKANRPLGWTYRIAQAIETPLSYLNLARPGAKSREILEDQLPIAIGLKPDIAVVVVGGNDMLRNNYSPQRLRENLHEVFARFTALGTEIITLQLHDPSKIIRLPKPLEGALMKRVDSVNRVYEELAKKFSIIEIKARDIKGVEDRKNWHVDRLHPGPRGHLLLARAAIQELSRRGLPVTEISISDPVEPSLSEKVRWMLLKGTPWFVKRSFDLLPVALFLMLREMINPSKFPQVCLEATLEGYDSSSAKEKEFTLV